MDVPGPRPRSQGALRRAPPPPARDQREHQHQFRAETTGWRVLPIRPGRRAALVVSEICESIAVVVDAVVAREAAARLRSLGGIGRAVAAGVCGMIDGAVTIVVDAVPALGNRLPGRIAIALGADVLPDRWRSVLELPASKLLVRHGAQQTNEYYAWPLRDGDTVPEPADALLFLSAVAALGWLRRRAVRTRSDARRSRSLSSPATRGVARTVAFAAV